MGLVGKLMAEKEFIDKITLLKKAQPIKLKTNMFAKGFRVEVEFNFDYNDPTHMDALIENDSNLRLAVRSFIQMVEEDTGAKLIRDDN